MGIWSLICNGYDCFQEHFHNTCRQKLLISQHLALLHFTEILFSYLVEDTLLSKTSILLICEGLDTVADVYINTVSVGQSTNMFQRYVWDIKKAVVTGGNKITIKFTSAVTYSAYKSKLYNYTIPPNCPPSVQHGECHVNLIRKKQCSFSWVSYFNHEIF